MMTMHFLYSFTSPAQHAGLMLLPSWDHLNKNLPYAPPSPSPTPHPPPKATTMVQHPLIKKRNSSQGAASLTVSRIWGGAAEPPNPRLSCISYCNCSTLGSKQLGDKAVWGQAGGLPRRVVRAKVWGKGWGGNLSTSNTVCLLKPNRETFDTNRTHWAAELTSLPLHKPSSPSFFLSSIEVRSQVDYCTFLPGTSQRSTPWPLPMVRFP